MEPMTIKIRKPKNVPLHVIVTVDVAQPEAAQSDMDNIAALLQTHALARANAEKH